MYVNKWYQHTQAWCLMHDHKHCKTNQSRSHTTAEYSGCRLNINMSPCQYMDPHVKDKTVFNMRIPIPGEYGHYIETGPWWGM